jgi:hypothetical protein
MKVFLGRYPKGDKDRTVRIRIDKWDTWNMDHTLALLIVPMLKQLKATKHGAPSTDSDDVPEHLKENNTRTEDGVDEHHFARWDWVLDEMIWTFEEMLEGHSKFFDHSGVDDKAPIQEQLNQMKVDSDGLQAQEERITNGLRLFGKYYRALWD